MKEEPESEARRWFLQAEYDLRDAQYLLEGERYNLACLLSQQSVEKELKAYLYSHPDVEGVKGHSVAALCKDATELDASFSKWSEEVAPLDKFYLTSRYPNSLPGGIPSEAFSEIEAASSIDIAKRFLVFARDKLGGTLL